MEKIGVVLFNLGGPDSLEAVEPFLYNLFQDPDIFSFPFASLVRKPLAKLISKRRAKTSRAYFEYMGGKSPITELTLRQAEALEKSLGDSYQVVVAMRYWNPSTQDALHLLRKEGIKKVVLLPLYPQYSYTTTRSSEREWDLQCKKMGIEFEKVVRISDYHDHPLYIQSVVERIREAVAKFAVDKQKQVHLLFSAHGIPLKEIAAGDPYDQQIRKSVSEILKSFPEYSYSLSYQSKVGRAKWLEPTTIETIETLAGAGKNQILAVPISFVSDHSETLYELKKLYGELALSLGVEQYELMPALNEHPKFIACLREVVIKSLPSVV